MDQGKIEGKGIGGKPFFPACYSFVLGVEATTQSNLLASFSNFDPSGPIVADNSYGYNYEIRAPGVDIWSTFPNANYNSLNGNHKKMIFRG